MPRPMQLVARSTPVHFTTPTGLVRGSASVQVVGDRHIQP